LNDSANTNLIQFPKSAIIKRENIVALHKNKESVEATQRELISQMIDYHAHHLVQVFALDGIDIESEDFDKLFALSIECLRATVYNTLDLHHPLLPVLKDMAEKVEMAVDVKEEE
tara:strand:- start:189 stop:533 length:345 start_codon:yes stop_codon:yes gene_type:complete